MSLYIKIYPPTICFVYKRLVPFTIFILSVKSSQATINDSFNDYEVNERDESRESQNQESNRAIENDFYNEDRRSNLQTNLQAIQNPYYEKEEQLDCPNSVVTIENPYYGDEELFSNENIEVTNGP